MARVPAAICVEATREHTAGSLRLLAYALSVRMRGSAAVTPARKPAMKRSIGGMGKPPTELTERPA